MAYGISYVLIEIEYVLTERPDRRAAGASRKQEAVRDADRAGVKVAREADGIQRSVGELGDDVEGVGVRADSGESLKCRVPVIGDRRADHMRQADRVGDEIGGDQRAGTVERQEVELAIRKLRNQFDLTGRSEFT